MCALILWVCYALLGKGEGIDKQTDKHGEAKMMYEQLELENVVGLPAFSEAYLNYKKYGEEQNMFTLIDFTKPSVEKRLCVVNLKDRKVLFRSHVAHGRNSGENYAVSFSNEPGSYKSSLGWFRTGSTYQGKNGYSLLLDGLERGINDKAKERAIVIHGAKYADPAVLKKQARLGRSLGCPALPTAVSKEIIDTIKNGTLVYIYGHHKTGG